MVSAALDVEGGQVKAVGRVLGSVEMVLHVGGDEGIAVLRRLADEATEHGVQLSLVESERSEEVLAQTVARRLAVVQDFGEDTVD